MVFKQLDSRHALGLHALLLRRVAAGGGHEHDRGPVRRQARASGEQPAGDRHRARHRHRTSRDGDLGKLDRGLMSTVGGLSPHVPWRSMGTTHTEKNHAPARAPTGRRPTETDARVRVLVPPDGDV